MGVENLSAASGVESEPVEREDPEAKYARRAAEREEARKARSEVLGHEIFEEKEVKQEEEPAPKKKAASKKSE